MPDLPPLLDAAQRLLTEGPSAVGIAIIGALAAILATTLPVLLPVGRKEPLEQQRIRLANDRLIEQLETQLNRLRRDLRERDTRIDELETMCFTAGINPHRRVHLTKLGEHDDE